MCGIIGILGSEGVADELVDGLKRLEYRGYDSAGIATLVDGQIERRRAEGKLKNLAAHVRETPLAGRTGIGHTRWATHGVPTVANAHPHSDGKVAVVHNGIIENFDALREELEPRGIDWTSDTDTETIVHLISSALDDGLAPVDAVKSVIGRLHGAFALAILFADHDNLMIGARKGSPLAIGYGEGEMYLGSDAIALAPLTNTLSYIEDGDWCVLTRDGVTVYDASNQPVERAIVTSQLSGALIGKGNYHHYMQKEIHEQPSVVGDTLHAHFNPVEKRIHFADVDMDFKALERLTITACGTAFYAGFVAKYWMEQLARIPVELDIASEFRYREAPMPRNGATIVLSQSGETIDTLEALRYSKRQGNPVLSIVNVGESAIARESQVVLQTLAGPEIGVASTKAFTTQLTVLASLALWAGRQRGTIDAATEATLSQALVQVPALMTDVLNHDDAIKRIAAKVADSRDVLYLGRGSMFPLALEGALKLKEISYIHAEGYAAGEMKHGPIALIDDAVPVVVCAPSGPLLEKTASNVEQVAARGGRLILITDQIGADRLGGAAEDIVVMPTVDSFVAPLLYAIPIQLLAYHTAVLKGTDVDQPRNLAKSVTVE
ncbi:MAG: glutamine--fructose-6-phosphate transaminase (isomerizing) [Alphaproteobacteria bacterium TMED89]|nr:glutamine--fructose-6-phosphate transaminase (isomerizing) [Rhodospirillaceae bacterium]RPH15396.1 MAG: glutamine--fructose-6-phosphate transaminase (isomerizing) [Alphaproteobacteria bacterium TMED89]